MTAAEQGYEPGWETYCAARDDYRTRHRHEPLETLARDAQRAGLAAALAAHAGEVPAAKGPGVFITSYADVAREMVRGGQWRTIGANGAMNYLEPAYVPAYPPSSTDPASPVDGAR